MTLHVSYQSCKVCTGFVMHFPSHVWTLSTLHVVDPFVLHSSRALFRIDDFAVNRIRIFLHWIHVGSSLLLSVAVLKLLNEVRVHMVVLPCLWVEGFGDILRKDYQCCTASQNFPVEASWRMQQLYESTTDDKWVKLPKLTKYIVLIYRWLQSCVFHPAYSYPT